MREQFVADLKQYDKKIIALETLERLCPGDCTYDVFTQLVQELIARGVLLEYGKQYSARDAGLCLKYRLNLYLLRQADREVIQGDCLRENFPQLMDVSYYLQAGLNEWQSDYALLQKIAVYLQANGLPQQEASDQERSYQIFGDEKVLLEKGRGILRKLRLEEKMRIAKFPDPLMMAVQPAYLQQGQFHHLIVENKATYISLLRMLPKLPFSSLIYGAGWKIVGNIICLPEQLGLINGEHYCYYFGDIDEEGIAIWHALQGKANVKLALPFYQKLLVKPHSLGKENQLPDIKAREQFFACFDSSESQKLREILDNHAYYPQECLTEMELLVCAKEVAKWI